VQDGRDCVEERGCDAVGMFRLGAVAARYDEKPGELRYGKNVDGASRPAGTPAPQGRRDAGPPNEIVSDIG
jgi:hypothetical protein